MAGAGPALRARTVSAVGPWSPSESLPECARHKRGHACDDSHKIAHARENSSDLKSPYCFYAHMHEIMEYYLFTENQKQCLNLALGTSMFQIRSADA